MSGTRIDSDERGVDDVAIENVKMFRMERMDNGCFWIRCYGVDGHDHVFWVRSSRQIKIQHEDEGASLPASMAGKEEIGK